MRGSVVAGYTSTSRLNRRLRPHQARVRSATHRRACTTTPRVPAGRPTPSTVTCCAAAAHSAQAPAYAPSAQPWASVGATAVATGSRSYAASPSGTAAGLTSTASRRPSVSTSPCRWRPTTLCPLVEATLTAGVAGRDALAVAHPSRRGRCPTSRAAPLLTQGGGHARPAPVTRPRGDLGAPGRPLRVGARQHAPLAAPGSHGAAGRGAR
jgi:hypothetical protein